MEEKARVIRNELRRKVEEKAIIEKSEKEQKRKEKDRLYKRLVSQLEGLTRIYDEIKISLF